MVVIVNVLLLYTVQFLLVHLGFGECSPMVVIFVVFFFFLV